MAESMFHIKNETNSESSVEKHSQDEIAYNDNLNETIKITIEQLNANEKQSTGCNADRDFAVNQTNGSSSNSPAKTISFKHYESLIAELKCPGCSNPLKAPTYLCKVGHSVCGQCCQLLFKCPLCQESFTNIRCLTIEALAAKALFKCEHACGGCKTRLQIDLLASHQQQCLYKPMKCLMGTVWGNCLWVGREVDWKEHLKAEHASKFFKSATANFKCNINSKRKSLNGYYVFEVYDELFNLYEIHERERLIFTITCSSPFQHKKHQFAYEIIILHAENEALALAHKYPMHSEHDPDILAEGTYVSILRNDLTKFINEGQMLHYRAHILKRNSPKHFPNQQKALKHNKLPTDFQQTHIKGVNLKNVPSHIILTRNVNNDCPSASPSIRTASNSSEDETDTLKQEVQYKKYNRKQGRSTHSGHMDTMTIATRESSTSHSSGKYRASRSPGDFAYNIQQQ